MRPQRSVDGTFPTSDRCNQLLTISDKTAFSGYLGVTSAICAPRKILLLNGVEKLALPRSWISAEAPLTCDAQLVERPSLEPSCI
jgi:hypothetical protein